MRIRGALAFRDSQAFFQEHTGPARFALKRRHQGKFPESVCVIVLVAARQPHGGTGSRPGLAERRARILAAEVYAVASARARRHLENAISGDAELRRLLDEVRRRELYPLTAVHEILGKVFHIDDEDDSDAR